MDQKPPEDVQQPSQVSPTEEVRATEERQKRAGGNRIPIGIALLIGALAGLVSSIATGAAVGPYLGFSPAMFAYSEWCAIGLLGIVAGTIGAVIGSRVLRGPWGAILGGVIGGAVSIWLDIALVYWLVSLEN